MAVAAEGQEIMTGTLPEQSDGCDSDWSTEIYDKIKKFEREVASGPILIRGRVMTTGSIEEEMTAGPNTAQTNMAVTSKLDHKTSTSMGSYATLRL